MALSRQEATEQAASYVDAIDAELLRRGRCLVWRGAEPLTLFRSLRFNLSSRVADLLQGTTPTRAPAAAVVADLRHSKDLIQARAQALRGRGRWRQPRDGRPVILAIPRTATHLRDMLLVAEQPRMRNGAQVQWLVFRSDHQRQLAGLGHAVALAGAAAALPMLEVVRLRAELALERRRWDGVPTSIADTMVKTASALMAEALVATRAVARGLERTSPALVWLGNPLTYEGRAGIAIGHSSGIPSASMQHGELGPRPIDWLGTQLDLFTVWGPGPRDALLGLGCTADRIAVTGNPWVDRMSARSQQRRARTAGARKRVLVALSGAGHAVGMEEHLGHVRALLTAARQRPDLQWWFRLHRKDDAQIYRRMQLELPGSDIVIEPAHAAGDIHDALAEADVLVTATSTAAVDAMMQGVPVVTLVRDPGEAVPRFVEAGATVPASLEAIAPVIASVLDAPLAGEVGERARQYVAQFAGPADGLAAQRVSDALLAVARPLGRARGAGESA